MPQDFSGIAVVFDTSNIGKAGLNSIRIVAWGGEIAVIKEVPGCNIDWFS